MILCLSTQKGFEMGKDQSAADFQAAVDRNRAFGKGPTAASSPNPKADGSDLYVAPKRDGKPVAQVTQPDATQLVIPSEDRRRYNP